MVVSRLLVIALAFIMALLLRVAVGSATVAMVTAAGLISPVLSMTDVYQPMLGLIVIAIASGSTALSHGNDSAFWLVNRFSGLTEAQALKAWTVMDTIIGFVGFGVALILSIFV